MTPPLPPEIDGWKEAYLYLCRFDSALKVGVTRHPQKRLTQLIRECGGQRMLVSHWRAETDHLARLRERTIARVCGLPTNRRRYGEWLRPETYRRALTLFRSPYIKLSRRPAMASPEDLLAIGIGRNWAHNLASGHRQLPVPKALQILDEHGIAVAPLVGMPMTDLAVLRMQFDQPLREAA